MTTSSFKIHTRPVLAAVAGLAMAALAPGVARSDISLPDTIHTTGYVEASFQWANGAVNGQIPGRLYGRAQNQFTMDAAELTAEHAVTPGQRSAGFQVKLIAGPSATPLKAAGLDLGPQADLVQASVAYNLPTSHGDVLLTMGKMTSMLGVEVFESVLNPNASVGSQFIFLEDFTSTGLDVQWLPSSPWSVRVRVANGWDDATDNNQALTVFSRIGFAPSATSSLALFGYTGAEQPDNNEDLRSGLELIAAQSLGRTALQAQFDVGHEDGIDADWWGIGVWARHPFNDALDLALRADYLDDTDGARTSGALGFPANTGNQWSTVTATLNARPVPALLLRPEVRFDHSNVAPFDGDESMVTLAFSAAFVF